MALLHKVAMACKDTQQVESMQNQAMPSCHGAPAPKQPEHAASCQRISGLMFA